MDVLFDIAGADGVTVVGYFFVVDGTVVGVAGGFLRMLDWFNCVVVAVVIVTELTVVGFCVDKMGIGAKIVVGFGAIICFGAIFGTSGSSMERSGLIRSGGAFVLDSCVV